MSCKAALYRYLTDPQALLGHPAEWFEATTVVAGIPIRTRNDARREIRSRVGKSIFDSRRPQNDSSPTCILLQTISDNPDDALNGETGASTETLLVTVLARAGDAASRVQVVADLLRLALAGYHHDFWGPTYIGECRVDVSNDTTYEPADASDVWPIARTLDVTVHYENVASPVYPVQRLTATISYSSDETAIRLYGGFSTIVPGRAVTNAHWILREDDAEGDIILEFDDDPNSGPGIIGIDGTALDPVVVDRVTAGLPGAFHATLILTDETGSTSTAVITGS